MKTNLFLKTLPAMLVASLVSFTTLSSCSDDDAPIPVERVEMGTGTFELDEAGKVTIEFNMVPAEAEVKEVEIAGKEGVFRTIGIAPQGNGKWQAKLEVTDFAQLNESEELEITVHQPDGTTLTAECTVFDPYSLHGKFTLVHPRGFNFYSIDPDQRLHIGLPVLVEAADRDNLALIKSKNIRVIDGEPSASKVGVDHFLQIPRTDDWTGFVLKVKPSKLDEVKQAIKVFDKLHFNVILTSENGRVTTLPLSAFACTPQGTFEDEQLTLSKTDLDNPKFEKLLELDVTYTLRQMGLTETEGGFTIQEIGLMNEQGEMMDYSPVLWPSIAGDITSGNFSCTMTVVGNGQVECKPGTYYLVLRVSNLWQHRNPNDPFDIFSYQTVCADLRIKIVIN